MMTCVMGFPAGSYIGVALTSIFEVDMPGRSAPETCVAPFAAESFLPAGFDTTSFELVLCPMFRISLYFGWLEFCQFHSYEDSAQLTP